MAEQKEILESIRDIVSGREAKDDDILELTEMLEADGSTRHLTPKPAPAAAPEPVANDVLSEIDSLLKSPARDEKAELEFQPKTEKFEIAEEFEPADVIAPRQENIEETQEYTTMQENANTIISDDSANAARASIAALTDNLRKEGRETNKVEPLAPFRNGDTVEDLVREMLKPMMKDWLDKNLPKLVNDIVQKEIQKLIPRD